jgi:hypothetical protein
VGEAIAKLAEDAYFMRLDNRVTQAPPPRTRDPRHNKATSRSPVGGERNRLRGEQPQNPNRVRAPAGGPSQDGNRAGGAGGSRGGALVTTTATTAIAGAEATRTATSPVFHTEAMMLATELKKYVARRPLRQATATISPPSPLNFATCYSRRNSNLWGSPSMKQSKTQVNGLGAMPYPLKMLVVTMTRSASTSVSARTKHHSPSSSRSTSTQ